MHVFVALLRAVNVGGTNRMPMTDLRAMCWDAGFSGVRTHIQSGNVVFATTLAAEDARSALETRLRDYAKRPVTAILRSGQEMREIAARNPFPEAAPDKVSVLFLDDVPAPGGETPLAEAAKGRSDEVIVPDGREIFIHYPSGMGRSRLRLPEMEHGTARNLNTVTRLAQMAASPGG